MAVPIRHMLLPASPPSHPQPPPPLCYPEERKQLHSDERTSRPACLVASKLALSAHLSAPIPMGTEPKLGAWQSTQDPSPPICPPLPTHAGSSLHSIPAYPSPSAHRLRALEVMFSNSLCPQVMRHQQCAQEDVRCQILPMQSSRFRGRDR